MFQIHKPFASSILVCVFDAILYLFYFISTWIEFSDVQNYCEDNDMDVAVVSNLKILSSIKSFIQSQLNVFHYVRIFAGYKEKYKEGEWINVVTDEVLINISKPAIGP